jgi:hypothetical protein
VCAHILREHGLTFFIIIILLVLPALSVWIASDRNLLESLYLGAQGKNSSYILPEIPGNDKNMSKFVRGVLWNISKSVNEMNSSFGISLYIIEPLERVCILKDFYLSLNKTSLFYFLKFPLKIPFASVYLQPMFLLILFYLCLKNGNIKASKIMTTVLLIFLALISIITVCSTYTSFLVNRYGMISPSDCIKTDTLEFYSLFIFIIIISIPYIFIFIKIYESKEREFIKFISIFIKSIYILFFLWYTLFWASVFNVLEGSSFSLFPRYSHASMIIAAPLETMIVVPFFLLTAPLVLQMTSYYRDRETYRSRYNMYAHMLDYWELFYKQVVSLGGGAATDILLVSFVSGIILTSLCAFAPFFYPFFVSHMLQIYKAYDISAIVQDIGVMITAVILWAGPVLGLLIFPERLISSSMGARIRNIIMENISEKIIVIGGSNRMVRPFIDMLIGILKEKSELIMREDGKLARISKYLCIVDYTGSLPDFSYEDPLMGLVGLMKFGYQESEVLLIPCASRSGADRADNVRDLLNKLRNLSSEEPKAIMVLSRNVKVQHACMEGYLLEAEKDEKEEDRERRGKEGKKKKKPIYVMMGTETSSDYRIHHMIAQYLMKEKNKGTNQGYYDTYFFELYTENIAESILHRIFALLADKFADEPEARVTIIGYSKALGYLVRLITLASSHVLSKSKISINMLVYPDKGVTKSIISKRVKPYSIKEFINKENKEQFLRYILRWNCSPVFESILKRISKISVISIPDVPLHVAFLTKLNEEKNNIEEILKESDLIVFLEDPKMGGRMIKNVDYTINKIFGDGGSNRNKPYILIGEGDLMSLNKSTLEWIRKRANQENNYLMAVYLYDRVTNPFSSVARELLKANDKMKETSKIFNAYFCIDPKDLEGLIACIENRSDNKEQRGKNCNNNALMGNVEIILPKVYRCFSDLGRMVAEALIRDENGKIKYIYICFHESIPISKVICVGSIKEMLKRMSSQKKNGVGKICKNQLGEPSRLNEIVGRQIVFPPEEPVCAVKEQESDNLCPRDFLCPLVFLKNEKTVGSKKSQYKNKILYMKVRPCIADHKRQEEDSEKRIFVEIYGVSYEKEEQKDDRMDSFEMLDTPVLGIIKDLCPLGIFYCKKKEQNKKQKEERNKIYFRIYPE